MMWAVSLFFFFFFWCQIHGFSAVTFLLEVLIFILYLAKFSGEKVESDSAGKRLLAAPKK